MKGLIPESDKIPIYDEHEAPHIAQRKRREWLQKGCWVIRIIPQCIPSNNEPEIHKKSKDHKHHTDKKQIKEDIHIKCALERHYMHISRNFDEIHCSKDANTPKNGSSWCVCTPESTDDKMSHTEKTVYTNDSDYKCDAYFHNLISKSPSEFLSSQYSTISGVDTPESLGLSVHTPNEEKVFHHFESQKPKLDPPNIPFGKSNTKNGVSQRKAGLFSSEMKFMYLYTWLGRLGHSSHSKASRTKSKCHRLQKNHNIYIPECIGDDIPQRIPLGAVVSIDFGVSSSTYQLLRRSQSWALMSIPPYLCWSIIVQYPNDSLKSKKVKTFTFDFIVCNVDHVESWVLGLNGLIRLTPQRTLYTPRLFKHQLRLLRIEYRRQQQLQVLLWYTEILKDRSKLLYSNTLIEELFECLCRINYVCAHHLPNKKSTIEQSNKKGLDVEIPCFCGVLQSNTAVNKCPILHTMNNNNNSDDVLYDTPESRQSSTAYSNVSTCHTQNMSSNQLLSHPKDDIYLSLPLNNPNRLDFNDDIKEKRLSPTGLNKKPNLINGKFCLICSLFNTKQDAHYVSSVHFYPVLPLLGGCICCTIYSNLVRPKYFLNFQGTSPDYAFYDNIKSEVYDGANDISSPSSVLCLSPRDDIDLPSEEDKLSPQNQGQEINAYLKHVSRCISKDSIFDFNSTVYNENKVSQHSLLSQSTIAASSCDSLGLSTDSTTTSHWIDQKSIKLDELSSCSELDNNSDEIVVFDPHSDIH